MIRPLKRPLALLVNHLDWLLLLAWLCTMGWLLLTGNDRAFLHPRFRPFLLIGAVLLTAFVLAMPWRTRRLAGGWQLADAIIGLLMVMTPLLFLYTVVGQGLGAHALTRKYTGTEQHTLARLLADAKGQSEAVDPKPEMSLLEIARRMQQVDGRQVVTEGLVYRPEIMPPNYLTLFRFAIFCCAADAMPVWVFVEKEGVELFADEEWIRVAGRVQIVNFNGTDVPVIKADSIVKKRAPSPGEQYMFF